MSLNSIFTGCRSLPVVAILFAGIGNSRAPNAPNAPNNAENRKMHFVLSVVRRCRKIEDYATCTTPESEDYAPCTTRDRQRGVAGQPGDTANSPRPPCSNFLEHVQVSFFSLEHHFTSPTESSLPRSQRYIPVFHYFPIKLL